MSSPNRYNPAMAHVTLDWLHVIMLFGALQGLFLAGALASKRSNRTANRLLAAAMLAFSIGLLTNAYHARGFVANTRRNRRAHRRDRRPGRDSESRELPIKSRRV